VPKHVRVNRKVEAGALANALDETIHRVRREWSTPFGGKNVAAVRELPL
jgi:hypothetical protein